MSTRRTAALTRREAHHERLIAAQETVAGQLRQMLLWLLVEARRAGLVALVAEPVRDLIRHVMHGTYEPTLWRLYEQLTTQAHHKGSVAEAAEVVRDLTSQLRRETFDPDLWRLCSHMIIEASRAGRQADIASLVRAVTDQIQQEARDARRSN